MNPSPATPKEGGRKASGAVRFLPAILLVAGLALFFALDLERYVTLDALRAHRALLQAYVAAHPVTAPLLFAAAYVLIVACSVPVGAVMTLAGGFLFGVPEGSALVVVSATLGASIVFLATRTALAERVRARLGPSLLKMQDVIRANAFNYILVLRLVPVFPFFVVNLAAGLLGVRFRTYALATFIGIIPGTVVYAGLGNGLGSLFDKGVEPRLDVIFRPAILYPLLGLAGLTLFPVLWRAFRRGTGD